MEYPSNPFGLHFRYILILLLSSGLIGCGIFGDSKSDSSSTSIPTVVYNSPPQSANNEPNDLAAQRIAMKKHAYVIYLYNNGRYKEASQEIETWTTNSEAWKRHLVNSPGDVILFSSLAIAFDKKEVYRKLSEISNNQADATTATIKSVASTAWREYSEWLNCIYSTQRNRSKCGIFERALLAKAPEANSLIK